MSAIDSCPSTTAAKTRRRSPSASSPNRSMSVAEVQVDGADERLARAEAVHVLADALLDRGSNHLGRVRGVGRDETARLGPEGMSIRQRFRFGDVEGGAGDLAVAQRGHEV